MVDFERHEEIVAETGRVVLEGAVSGGGRRSRWYEKFDPAADEVL